MIPLTIKERSQNGTSMTLGSIRNSSRYFFTSSGLVLSGEPRFTRRTPFIIVKNFRRNYSFQKQSARYTVFKNDVAIMIVYEFNPIKNFFGVVPNLFLKAAIKWLAVL